MVEAEEVIKGLDRFREQTAWHVLICLVMSLLPTTFNILSAGV